jgi:hypothetical protein
VFQGEFAFEPASKHGLRTILQTGVHGLAMQFDITELFKGSRDL